MAFALFRILPSVYSTFAEELEFVSLNFVASVVDLLDSLTIGFGNNLRFDFGLDLAVDIDDRFEDDFETLKNKTLTN